MKLPGERLRWAREEAHFTSARSAALALGMPVSTYNSHERAGEPGGRMFDPEDAKRYGRRFRVRWTWLLTGEGVAESREVQVPLISWVQAGDLATVETIPEGSESDEVVTTNLPAGGRWVALKVEGNSMDLVAPHGSRIFVNREEIDLVSGRYYVVCFDDGKATFKRYRENPKRFEPESTDRTHDTIFPADHAKVTVVGRVRKIVHDLD